MPTTSVNRNAGIGPSAFTLRLPVERGRLKAVSVTQVEGDPTYGGLNASIFVASEPATPSSILAHLASGIFTEYQPLGWTGDINLEPNMTVYARLRTLGQAQVKLAIIVED